jgi:MoxR-like ATPase
VTTALADTQALADAVEKYNAVIASCKRGLVERNVELDLIFACLPAHVHPLFIGGAGIAKSQLVDSLIEHIDEDIPVFTRLLAKDTPSEEVLGPPNLAALERGSWERVIDHKIQTAVYAFLDEVFKCNSTVLNALLKIINERIFENNGDKIKVPLKSLVGASNELPGHDRDDLRAFRDRFGICKIVEPVRTDDGKREVLGIQFDRLARGGEPDPNRPRITLAELALIEEAVPRVKVPDSVRDDYVTLHRKAEAENLTVSLRRMFEGMKVAMTKAVLRGSDTMASEDLAVFQHNLWTDPEDVGLAYDLTLEFAGQVAKKAAKFRTEFDPILAELNELKPQIPTDGDITQELAGSFARVNMLLKNLDGRVAKAKEDAEEEQRDVTALAEIGQQIAEARQYVKDDVLGFGM